jgi:protein TIF31
VVEKERAMDAMTNDQVMTENEKNNEVNNTNENSEEKTENENVESQESQEQLPMANFLIMTPTGEAIPLNYVSLMENISYLKQNLSEFLETCGYTNYSLEYRPEGGEASTLSDYAELNAYFGEQVGQTFTLQMVPQLYDAKTARTHVKRTRDILSYPPQLKGVATKPKELKAEPASSEAPEETKEASLEEMKANIERVKAALPTDGDIFSAQSVSLKDYYQEVLYRVSANPDTPAHASQSPADSIRSIFFSGWNPPPPPRKLRGDLFYLEVHFAVPNAPALHITAQSHGFYINKSSTSVFDPSPAPNANFSHELLDTLIASSPAISNSWNAISKKIDQEIAKSMQNTEEDIATAKANSLEPVAALYAQGRGDLVAQVPEWTYRPLDGNRKNKNLNYDMSRAQDDLCDSFGIEEKGALREWFVVVIDSLQGLTLQ